MLRGIHKASSTWLGKGVLAVIMGFLVISFAIWGIGDIFRGFGKNSAIEIGGTEITVEHLRNFYNDQLRQISRRLGRPVTPEQARTLGIDRQVIGRLVAETTLDEQAKALGLNISDAEIAKRIVNDPSFRGATGKFDRARFEELIRQAGYTEARFVAAQRDVMLRRQLAQSLAGDLHVPTAAKQVVDRFRNEKRTIDYLALTAAQAGDTPAPTAEQLSKYFEEHKALFRAPEYRKVTLLTLSPAAIAKPDEVSDADAKKYYEQHMAEFGKPERREVKQIVFPSAKDAAAAREKIDKGASFADLVKERGLKPSDTDLGMVTKSAIINPDIAAAAFSLKPGDVSQPIKGAFGTVLVTVGKIEPGEQKPFEKVAPEIKKQIAESRAKIKIEDMRDKIEDERAAGSTLAETGQKLGLKVRTIDAVDRSGRAPDGKPVPDLPQNPNVVQSAYATDVGVDNEALRLPNGGYLYYSVTGITPSRARKLDEVKDKVTERWRDDEIAKRLKAKTDEMIGKLKSGTTLAQLATETGLKVQKQADLQRGKPAGFLPGTLIQAAFATPKGVPAATAGSQPTTRYVFQVTAVSDPKLEKDSAEAKQITDTLQNSYADDITGEYISQLEKTFGIEVNQSAVNQVIGASQ
jgi:peptidyl-prolyl cis-trans isomerase D